MVQNAKRPFAAVWRPLQRRVWGMLVNRGGLDISGFVSAEAAGDIAHEREFYVPSWYSAIPRAFRALEVDREDVFVDYGSGKGLVVIQAALRHPFREVIGVEISAELTRIARANVELAHDGFRAREVRLVVADATAWSLPDDVTYIYMYNPFTGETFQTVLDRIVDSLDRRPRKLTLIYLNPKEDEVIRRSGRFELGRISRGLRPDLEMHRIHFYASC